MFIFPEKEGAGVGGIGRRCDIITADGADRSMGVGWERRMGERENGRRGEEGEWRLAVRSPSL